MPSIIRVVHCLRCGKDWYPHKPGRPARCAGCRDALWDQPKRPKPAPAEGQKEGTP